MFYSQFILAKKGPLGTIWIAAHLERKLRKNQVSDTDIGVSVDSILFPEMPIALRLSSHLLLGVVRIYSKKVSYLFDDCSEALLKVKQAFRATDVDLPPEESTAPYNSITIPETFDLEDFDLPDNENFQGSYVDHHVGAKEQITLEDTMEGVIYSTAEFGQDERFGDGDASGLDLNAEILVEKAATAGNACDTLNSNDDPQASFEAGTPVKHNEYQDDLSDDGADQIEYSDDNDDGDGDGEPIEYVQASCTPGLLEEPNVPNNQETSICDDQQEHGNHNTTESENENLKNAFCNVQNNQDNQETSTCDDHQQEKSMPVMEHVSMDEIMKTTPPPFYPIGMGISMDDHDLNSTRITDPYVADEVRKDSPRPEVLGTVITMIDGHDGTKDTLNQNSMDKELGVQFTHNNSEKWVKVQGNECHLTTQLESNAETLETSQREKPSNGSEYSALVQDAGNLEDGKDEINADPVQVMDIPSLDSLETSQREKPSNVSGNSVLVEGYGSHANNTLDLNLQEIYNSQQPVHSQDQVAQSFYTSVPAAEQLLSIPPESSFQEDIERGNEGYYGNDMIMGKKRSITEMLKAQSLNHVQSSGFLNTKTTSPSVSNDDLLSSILVGRSSVMEAKPTPPRQLPSKRRRQSAPKTVVSKRKVPMDDCTVLHGDLIREQLINTGDIRRPRRKVPCTWLEISMIEKRFREDEVFNETLFTGASIKLASLHNRSYNISRIKVFQKKEDPPALKPISHLEIENENKENLAEGNQACENSTRSPNYDGGQEQMNTREENEVFMQKTADAVSHIKSDEKMDVMFVADMDINSKNIESKNVEIIEAKDEVVVDIQKDIVTLDQETEEVGKIEEETLQPNKLVPEICSEDKQISGDPNTQVDGDELEYSALVNNTDFLKYDEEEEEDEDDDDSTDTEAKRSTDNTEWSSRTKAVSKYLQVMFDKEEEHGRMSLRMNSLLSGKTRKEASRMFFETLVLKTKDYIHVEQSDPFENIDILPTSKLLKSVF